MLKKDKITRTKFMVKLEKEKFELFPDSFYKTSSKIPKKVHKGDMENKDYDVRYVSVRERDDWDSNDDEEEDLKTPPHYYSDGGYSSED